MTVEMPESDSPRVLMNAVEETSQEILRHREFTRRITDTLVEGLITVDRAGRATFMNPAAERLLGWTREELLGHSIHDTVHHRSPAGSPLDCSESEMLRALHAGATTRHDEDVFVRKDGSAFPVVYTCAPIIIDGEIIGAVITFSDITEAKRASEFRRLQDRALQAVSEGIVITDARQPDTPVIYHNAGFEKLTGYSADEIRGRNCRFLQGAETDPATVAAIRAALSEGRPYSGEILNYRKDGTSFWNALSISPVRDAGGTISHHVGVQQEITGRKRIEKALRESEERYRLLVELSPEAIIVHSEGKIVFANPAGARIHGAESPDQLVGRAALDMVHPDHRENARNQIQKINDEGAHVQLVEDKLLRLDGTSVDVELTAMAFAYQGKPAVQVVVRDISTRKRAEAEALLLQRTVQAVGEAEDLRAALAVTVREVCRATGWALGETWIPSQDNTRLEPGPVWHDGSDSLEKFKQESMKMTFPPGVGIAGRAWATKQPVWVLDVTKDSNFSRAPLALEAGLKTGFAIPVLFGEEVIAVIAILDFYATRILAEDKRLIGVVSTVAKQIGAAIQRKQADEALRKSQARYERMSANIPGMVFQFLLRANGSIEFPFVSEGCRELYELEFEEIRANPLLIIEIIEAEDRAGFDASVAESARTLQPWSWEGRVTLQSGKEKWLQGASRPERQPDGSTIWDGLLVDITERKHLEEQLRQSQKLEAVGKLAGGIAHDFNNLLTVITGYSDLTLKRLTLDDPTRRNVEEIKHAGERAAGLTRQLLAYSRKQMLQPKVLDLNKVVTDVEGMLRRLIGEDIYLTSACASRLGRVQADPGQIEQVLMNLAVNARDAMPRGGRLTIETANVALDNDYARRHADVQAGRFVMLAVTDTGTGMDADTRAQIFEPFFTTKETGKGTGLGLSTVYGIVKQSGGHIWVYSEVGHGTTFKVYLPRVDAEAAEAESVESDEFPRGTETVLLVEDEPQVREMTRAILDMGGYSVISGGDGIEALRHCEQHGNRIQLLITDVVMPQMGGRQLVEKCLQITPEMRVLYISGYTDEAIVHHGVLDAGTHFLQKPFSPESLLKKVREVLDAGASPPTRPMCDPRP